jgi:hypothetical protein
MVPLLDEPPRTLSTYHFTPVFVVPATVAANCLVVFFGIETEVGLMLTEIVTVTAALALLLGSALLVTRTVCGPVVDGAV